MGYTLRECLDKIKEKRLVIPNFQRQYDWQDEDVRNLIASLFFKVKIGALLLYRQTRSQDDKDKKNFLPFLTFDNQTEILSTKWQAPNPIQTLEYVIDGQQRLTSALIAFSSFFDNNPDFSRKYKRSYYLRFPKKSPLFGLDDENLEFKKPEIGSDFDYDEFVDNYIIPVSQTKDDYKIEDDKHFYIPLNIFYQTSVDQENKYFVQRVNSIKESIKRDRTIGMNRVETKEFKEKVDNWAMSLINFLQNILQQEITTIFVKDNLQEAIKTYEILNTTGKQLTDLDILSAEYSRTEKTKRLYDEIVEGFQRPVSIDEKVDEYNLVKNTVKYSSVENTHENIKWNFSHYMMFNRETHKKVLEQFMKLLKFCELRDFAEDEQEKYRTDSYKADSLLKLESGRIKKYKDEAIDAISWASMFFQVRCGLKNINALTNFWQLFVLAALKCEFNSLEKQKLDYIEAWYFLSRFKGRYRIDQNKIALSDLRELTRTFDKNIDYSSEIFKKEVEELQVIPDEKSDKYDIKDRNLRRELLLMESEVAEPFDKVKDFICEYGIRKGYYTKLIDGERRFVSTLIYPYNDFFDKYKLEQHHLFPVEASKDNASVKATDLRHQKVENSNEALHSPLNFVYLTKTENVYIGSKQLDDYYDKLDASFIKHNVIKEMKTEKDFTKTLENRYKEFFNDVYLDLREKFNKL